MSLPWLPLPTADWKSELKGIAKGKECSGKVLSRLCNYNLSVLDIMKVDKVAGIALSNGSLSDSMPVIRLAILSSCTVQHLLPSIRVAALRHGFILDVYCPGYGQMMHEIFDENSELHKFCPEVVLFSFDTPYITNFIVNADNVVTAREGFLNKIQSIWKKVEEVFGAVLIQQTLLPNAPSILGNNEQNVLRSRQSTVMWFNDAMRSLSTPLLAIDKAVAQDGISGWYDQMLWYRAKQEIHPAAAPLYGELLSRLINALQGRSRKCLVLDLDNTLWGGVVGDDGIGGITLGQGSAAGEAFLAFQDYVLELKGRGIILAVCSKNTEEVAKEVFIKHPDMRIRLQDIACFVANWTDKATNLRQIAHQLNIDLSALVFVDDNPAERSFVRQELPMVAVPELPEDVGLYADLIAKSGYFEGINVTEDDLNRTTQYNENLQRKKMKEVSTDIDSYLKSLDMKLVWQENITTLTLPRVVQLINKTNQFNLTGLGITEQQAESLIGDLSALQLVLRLKDSFGDNGIVSAVTGTVNVADYGEPVFLIDRWVMSCRVFKRGLEEATLDLLINLMASRGLSAIVGVYIPTERNAIFSDLYEKLGFSKVEEQENGASVWRLAFPAARLPHHLAILEGN